MSIVPFYGTTSWAGTRAQLGQSLLFAESYKLSCYEVRASIMARKRRTGVGVRLGRLSVSVQSMSVSVSMKRALGRLGLNDGRLRVCRIPKTQSESSSPEDFSSSASKLRTELYEAKWVTSSGAAGRVGGGCTAAAPMSQSSLCLGVP